MKFAKLLTAALLCGVLGCERSEMQARQSLHEHDHEIPAHWPDGLGDAVVKMRTRMALLQSSDAAMADREMALAELRDLVNWLPEVAAETDLPEPQWMPIYEASERLSATLRRARSTDVGPVGKQILVVCELAAEAAQKLAVPEVAVILEAEH